MYDVNRRIFKIYGFCILMATSDIRIDGKMDGYCAKFIQQTDETLQTGCSRQMANIADREIPDR